MEKGTFVISAQGTKLENITCSGMKTLKILNLMESIWLAYRGLESLVVPIPLELSFELESGQLLFSLENGQFISESFGETLSDSTLHLAREFICLQVMPAIFPAIIS